MIKVTKINGQELFLNPHLIEKMEERPDTLVTMQSQVQYIVKEKVEEITKLIVEYRRTLYLRVIE
jgi:flagellar protein FlbD